MLVLFLKIALSRLKVFFFFHDPRQQQKILNVLFAEDLNILNELNALPNRCTLQL